jgi:hypothetical protein
LETGEEDIAEQDGSEEMRMTIPLTVTAEDSRRLAGATDDPRHTIDKTVSIPMSAVSESSPCIFRPSPWTRFHLPRRVVRTGIALVLLAVLVIAFSVIRQPQKSNGVATGELPAVASAPSRGFLSAEMPTPPIKPPAAPTGAVSRKPATDAAAAMSESPLSVETVPASAANGGRDVSKAAEVKPPLLDASAESTTAGLAAPTSPPTTPPVPARAEQRTAGPLDFQADAPLTGAPSRETVSASADQLRYPATDPGTFQYPADYHVRLRSRVGSPAPRANEANPQGLLLNAPTTSEASVYGWQPHTARLQPPMEPPPMR